MKRITKLINELYFQLLEVRLYGEEMKRITKLINELYFQCPSLEYLLAKVVAEMVRNFVL